VKLEKEFRKLEAAAGKEFRAEGWHGRLEYERSLDLRYRGEGYELNVPAAANVTARVLATQFHDEHQRRYGYHHAGREIELVTLRLRARFADGATGSTRAKGCRTDNSAKGVIMRKAGGARGGVLSTTKR